MATDPARAKKRTLAQWRHEQRQSCRARPCSAVAEMLATGKTAGQIRCVICVWEGQIKKIAPQ